MKFSKYLTGSINILIYIYFKLIQVYLNAHLIQENGVLPFENDTVYEV